MASPSGRTCSGSTSPSRRRCGIRACAPRSSPSGEARSSSSSPSAPTAAARAKGLPLIDEAPRQGLAGLICFLHPKGTRGVLVELATPPPGEHAPPAASTAASTGPLAGLALEEVTARSRDAASAADLFASQLGLAREACGAEAGLAAAAVSAGGVRLRFVSADPRSAGAEAAELRAAA